MVRYKLKYSVELFFCRFDIARLEQKQAEIENDIDIAGIPSKFGKKRLTCETVLTVRPIGLGLNDNDRQLKAISRKIRFAQTINSLGNFHKKTEY